MGAAYRKAKGIPQMTFTCTPEQKTYIDNQCKKLKLSRQEWIIKVIMESKK